jgi:hypothetical protein
MKINAIQRWIAVLAAVLFVIVTLFPPWLYTYDQNGTSGGRHSRPAGYHCIFSPPPPEISEREQYQKYYGVRFDSSALFIEYMAIAALAGAAWFLFRADKPRRDDSCLNAESEKLAGDDKGSDDQAPMVASNLPNDSAPEKKVIQAVAVGIIGYAAALAVMAMQKNSLADWKADDCSLLGYL